MWVLTAGRHISGKIRIRTPNHRAGDTSIVLTARIQSVTSSRLCVAALCAVSACSGPRDDHRDSARATGAAPAGASILVYTAAAIAQPMRAVLDTFVARTGVRYTQETGSSLELARKISELGGEPDVVALADPDIFPALLEPRFTTWHAVFARNRIVLAYTAKSRGAAEIDSTNWYQVLERPGVEVGRSDPNTDPSGYRTLLVWQLAERHYKHPGLYDEMLRAAPPKNVRPREADQVALLQIGELDYIWTYQNLADNAGLRYVTLPATVDLGTPSDSAAYALASTRVVGKSVGDTITIRGGPILFGVTVPTAAPRRDEAQRFVAFLLSANGTHILRRTHLDALNQARLVGRGAPASIRAVSDTTP